MFTEQVDLASASNGERNIRAPRLSEVDDLATAGHTQGLFLWEWAVGIYILGGKRPGTWRMWGVRGGKGLL